jgi:DNA-binding beta-propeller fold protein YncE
VIDTGTNQVVGAPIPVGTAPEAIAITPDQPPVAAFTGSIARPGVPVTFNAAGSRDFDGTISRFDWEFGDGQSAPNGGSTPKHTYAKPGEYRVTLTLTDNDGCSTKFVFTGQTAYCNGGPAAGLTQSLSVSYPGVRVTCPTHAGRKDGCRFKLTAVTKRRRGKAMTKTAKARVTGGRRASTIVLLKPKPNFAVRLASAKKILVREVLTIGGSTKKRFAKLAVVR